MRLVWKILKTTFSSLFLAIVTLVGAPAAFCVTVLAALILLPLPATVPVPKSNPVVLPTTIYDRYGNPIATLQQYDSNIPVTENQIPEVLKEAVISDEEHDFYHDGGFNLRGTVRAFVDDLRGNGPLQGGSTITGQYVKLAYLNQQRTLVRKVREAILASQLARVASKNEILYRYLTLVYFGDGNTGVGAASESYFHVPVQDLNASEAATLAGLIPAPTARAPRENPIGAEQARELVLGEMYKQGYLTMAEYASSMKAKLIVLAQGEAAPAGRTAIYPYQTSATYYPAFVDYVVDWLKQHFPASEIYGGGLRVQTTLDPAVQNAAYTAVSNTLANPDIPAAADMAMAAVQPQTGFVEAVVAGRHFGQAGSPYEDDNLALGGCTPPPGAGADVEVKASCWSSPMISGGTEGRQPGSAWKPFVLATAFEQGIQPTAVYDAPAVYTIPGCQVYPGQAASVCQIHNDEGDEQGRMTLAYATWQSINTVYAQVAPQVGCPNVAQTAKSLGIESAYYATPVAGKVPPNGVFYNCSAYALGEVDVSPLDMASAYGVFADHGQRAQPTPILEIVNSAGKVLVNNISPLPSVTQVLPANIADNVTNVLQGVLTQGTAAGDGIGRPAAGKTGTVSNYTDAWFVGYTPSLSAAVWMGDDAGEDPIGGPCYSDGYCPDAVYGATYSAPTWRNFMMAALQGTPATPFSAPAPIVAPKPAAALQIATTTTMVLGPGTPGQVIGTPTGGPYQLPTPPPVAPEPTTTTTSTTTTTTTTIPNNSSTTTSSTTSTSSTVPFIGGPSP
jgi:penicillin-binding protein 1A